ncbi:MAG: hypothetical protein E4H14_03635 [Candidatus Thorarchaeota archaeon]|nr:MAG: hypothetical protein E4H14_03635 [Candidatus Thorarchaeota archaeon]
MATYNINYSDPLRSGFTIAQGGFNGPGGSAAASVLRLYGRGALEWGEAVDEDLLRALENFNGATPPPFPIGGQIWHQTVFYWLHTANTWYVLDPDTPGAWIDIGPTGSSAVTGGVAGTNTAPAFPAAGAYWYTAGAPSALDAFGNAVEPFTLYLYDLYAPPGVAIGWLKRVSSVNAAAPVNGVDYPARNLLTWDEFTEDWVDPPLSIAGLGGLLADGSIAMTGNLDLNSFNIINLADPVNPQDAMTYGFAETRYVNTAGDTLTGFLILNADPVAALGAVTRQYVDSAVGAGSGVTKSYTTGTVSHNPGDIYVQSGRIWIAVTMATSAPLGTVANPGTPTSDANWKHVFPAQYS